MDYLMNLATTTLAGTLTIPEPLPPATSAISSFLSHVTATNTHTHHHKSHTTHSTSTTSAPTSTISALPPPPFEIPGHHGGHHGHHGGGGHGGMGRGGLEKQMLGRTGEVTFWVVFGLFTAGMIFAILASKRVAANLRLFHHLTAIILGTAMVSYLVMATGMGATFIPILSHAGGDRVTVLREVFYARYIDWAITTPLLLLDLSLLAGLPWASVALIAIADEGMILTGLFAALVKGERDTFILYTVSCLFFLYVLYTLVIDGRAAAKLQSDKVNRTYSMLMIITVLLWTGYPIVFGLGEATGVISVDAETVVYAVLDVIAKLVFGIILIVSHSHTEGDSVLLPDSWVHARNSAGAGYGTLASDE